MQQEWYVSDFVLWSKNWSADHLSPLPINQSDFRKVDQVCWEILPFCCCNIFSFYGWSSPKRYPTPWKSDRILIPTIFFGMNPVCWAASPTHDYSLYQSYQIPFLDWIYLNSSEFLFFERFNHIFSCLIGSKTHPVRPSPRTIWHLSWTLSRDPTRARCGRQRIRGFLCSAGAESPERGECLRGAAIENGHGKGG